MRHPKVSNFGANQIKQYTRRDAHLERPEARRVGGYLRGAGSLPGLRSRRRRRCHQSVGAGYAIAIQNLAENSTMLVMIGVYTLVMRAGASVIVVAAGFGAALSVAIAVLWWSRVRYIGVRKQRFP
jgi:hypothetical protein